MRRTYDTSFNVSLASVWQFNNIRFFSYLAHKFEILHCRQTHNFHNVSNSAQVTAGLSPSLDLTRIYQIRGKCADQCFIYLYVIYENFEISSFKSETSTLTVLTSAPNTRFPLLEMHEKPAVQNNSYIALM